MYIDEGTNKLFEIKSITLNNLIVMNKSNINISNRMRSMQKSLTTKVQNKLIMELSAK